MVRTTAKEFDALIRGDERWPTLRLILGAELDAMERVVAAGQAGKYAGKSIYATTYIHQLDKFSSHFSSGGALMNPDTETGEAHIIHAAIRLLMAHAVARATCDPIDELEQIAESGE